MNINDTEIERKFLIRFPDTAFLAANGEKSEITQTYLLSGAQAMSERVRKRSFADGVVFTHTCKTHITSVKRIEIENEISEAEYLELLKRADPERNVIHKTRWCISYKGKVFEIDVFPFWNDRAYMEIELESEDEEIELPPYFSIIKEVTSDKRYNNSSLARSIPMDEI